MTSRIAAVILGLIAGIAVFFTLALNWADSLSFLRLSHAALFAGLPGGAAKAAWTISGGIIAFAIVALLVFLTARRAPYRLAVAALLAGSFLAVPHAYAYDAITLPADMIATSDDWNTAKPDPAFFREVIGAAPCDAGQIVYVGDRLDNDLRPAKAAGMRTAFIRRGPWGYIQDRHPDLASAADWRMTTLAELPMIVAEGNAVIALTVVFQL